MHPREADLEALLTALADAQIEFIVVGGVAAVLHGAPTTTQDLDIVHRRSPENVARLAALLARLDAEIREPGHRHLRPNAQQLASVGQLNLSTLLGPLDPLGVLHDGRGYDELLGHTIVMHDGNRRLVVLDLETLIEIKSTTGRPKDQLIVPVLMAIQDELAKK